MGANESSRRVQRSSKFGVRNRLRIAELWVLVYVQRWFAVISFEPLKLELSGFASRVRTRVDP